MGKPRRQLVVPCFFAWSLLVIGAEGVLQPGDNARTTLTGQVQLARVVDLAAQRLGVAIEYDPQVLTGTVTLRAVDSFTDDELWALTNRLLAARGLTTVRAAGDDTISVVRIADAPNLARIESTDADALAAGYKAVVLRLEHRGPQEIVEAIGRLLSKPGGSITPIGQSGLILLSDLAPRVDQAIEMIERIDVPVAAAVLDEVRAANLPASRLATLANQLSLKREQVSGRKIPGEVLAGPDGTSVFILAPQEHLGHWRGLLEQLDRREEVTTVTYAPRTFGVREVGALVEQAVRGPEQSADRWRLVVDELTGTLIVTATPAQHGRILDLLERLQSVPAAARRPVRTYVVRNRNVNEVAQVIEGLLSAGVLQAGAYEPDLAERASEVRVYSPPAGAPLLPRPDGILEQTPTAPMPDTAAAPSPPGAAPPAARRSGASAQGAAGADAGRPREPDLPPLVITVDEGTSTLIATGDPRLLAQLDGLIRQLDVRQPQVMLEVLLVSLSDSQTLDLGMELEALNLSGETLWRVSSLFGLSTRTGDTRSVGDASGLTGVVLNPGDFAVVLRALETINRGRSLSMPKVLASNNQPAVIDSVLQVPFTVINASDTVATTSFGGTLDAGTVVTIRPQIAQGDHLLLEYSVRLSSFVGASANPTLPPPRQQNQVQSVVSIPDGHTVVVGGLELITDDRAISQVPLLGRVPLLGELFKNRSLNTSRTRFFVFIRAGVLRDGQFEDLKHLSAQAIEEAQVDDGWPVLEPRIMR